MDATTQILSRVIVDAKGREIRRELVDRDEHRSLTHRLVLSGDTGHIALPNAKKTTYVPVRVVR